MPADAGMDPSVFYYKCGLSAIDDITEIHNKNIIDAGAYIGDSSIVLAAYTERNVYAFEASKANCSRIMDVCRYNNVKNVVPIEKALGNCTKTELLYLTPSGVGNGIVKRKGISYESELTVESISLDDFIELHHMEIGLIKTDIEGGEMGLLEGAQRTIKEQRPVLLISIYHTADDFFGIKAYIEKTHPGYKFSIFEPYVRNRVIRDTMLVCVPR